MLRLVRTKVTGYMQWLQETKRRNVNNLNNVKREASIHFREKTEYVKEKLRNMKLTVRQKSQGFV